MPTTQPANHPDVSSDAAALDAAAARILALSDSDLRAEMRAAGIDPDAELLKVRALIDASLARHARASAARPAPGHPWLPSQVWQLMEREMREYVHRQQVQQRPFSRLDMAQQVYESLDAEGLIQHAPEVTS